MSRFCMTVRPVARRCAVFALALVLFFTGTMFCGSADAATTQLTDATVKAYEEQLAALAKKEKEVLAQINNLRSQQASWQEQKAAIDSYLNTVERKMEAADILVAQLENQVAVTTQEIENIRAEYDRVHEKFLAQIVVSYEEGEASYLGLILGSDSLGDFLSRVERVSSMLEYQKT